MKQTAYIGESLRNRLREIINTHQPKRILLITGQESFIHSGAKEQCQSILKETSTTIFSDFSPNPKLEDLKKGIAVWKECMPDLILAIGGGSAIDIAKAVNILAVHSEDPTPYIRGMVPLEKRGVPFIAVPTTAGTGAEATHFAVVYIDGRKYSLAHEYMLPDYAIIDPSLTFSMSPYLAAVTGADALSQSVESFWSIHSTEESKEYARESLALIRDNFVSSVNGDRDSRTAMSRAAYLSGKAINISKTTAAHAMSYSLTARFGIPHGQAVIITLPQLFFSTIT